MAPIRTLPAAVKPVKTERTHEENQERAYIAASRRSDRSLEARVESARRASEIHKRRTGRSLRVTEQDVVNEEMYEEEDDDLPMQYRRLTAHLQTTNAEFDRRLTAYLTNHMAMRTAIGQAISDGYSPQPYPGQQFVNQQQYMQSPYPTPMMPPQMTHRSPHSYRQSPYPMPAPHVYGPNLQSRPMSVASSHELGSYPPNTGATSPADAMKQDDVRSMSSSAQPVVPQTPRSTQHAVSSQHASPVISRTGSSSSLANLKHEGRMPAYLKPGATQQPELVNQDSSKPQQQSTPPQQHPETQQPSFAYPMQTPLAFDPNYPNLHFSPLSMALPRESQQLLGPALDVNDQFNAMLMQGYDQPQQPFYSYNPNGTAKSKKSHPSYDGMNQTLAPGALDTKLDLSYSNPSSAHTDGVITPFTPSFGLGYDGWSTDPFKMSTFTRSNSGQNSGVVTPTGDRDWANLIDGNFWEEQPSTA
ncbi:hypothetical protein LTR66_005594 [Elasticomyces elasticus]|nr:hypothetical protein LTR66_005594 [Elasticomyces elasticus]